MPGNKTKNLERNLPTRTVARKENKKHREKPSNENSCQERKQKNLERNLPTRTVARTENKKLREKPSNENTCQETKQKT